MEEGTERRRRVLKYESGGNNFNCFADKQLTKFSARDAGDFSEAAGEREMAPKCGSLPRDAGRPGRSVFLYLR